jgi:hypothetical protein
MSGWISKLQEGQRLKSSSVRQFVAAIKLFYEMNSIALPWKKIKRGIKRIGALQWLIDWNEGIKDEYRERMR